MSAAVVRHDALLREAIERHGGAVFKTVGDAFHAAFVTAADALAAALSAQRALLSESWSELRQTDSDESNLQHRTSPIAVRMALHSGTAAVRAGDYFGRTLNHIARLLAAGHGGQILLSAASSELLREHLPPDVLLRELGAHWLKSLPQPEQIYQLVAADLPSDFPALHTLDCRTTNLPAQTTAFIGREREIAAVRSLLDRADVRLVTLTGPGGTGKTRLGQQLALELLDDFPDGVWFVHLAPISDPGLVAARIAQTLSVHEGGGQPIQELLKNYLRAKRLLLLLDNFEQIAVAAPWVGELLAAARGL
jgi:ATP-dependent Clp protease ATP-binding subunit ClpA